MSDKLRDELEQERQLMTIPGYFGFAEAKDHAHKILPLRIAQLKAVLAYCDNMGFVIREGGRTSIVVEVADIRRAIEEATP